MTKSSAVVWVGVLGLRGLTGLWPQRAIFVFLYPDGNHFKNINIPKMLEGSHGFGVSGKSCVVLWGFRA